MKGFAADWAAARRVKALVRRRAVNCMVAGSRVLEGSSRCACSK